MSGHARRRLLGMVALALLVAAGESALSALCPASGCLDPSFGTSGVVELELAVGGNEAARAVVIQPDGKAILAGMAAFGVNRTGYDVAIARLDVTGQPDLAFGSSGVVRVAFTSADDAEAAEDVVLAPNLGPDTADFDIVACGYAPVSGGRNPTWGIAVVRLNSDGTLATEFGGGTGRVLFNFANKKSAFCGAVALWGDRIVVAARNDDRIAVARLMPNGAFDTSFGGSGKVTTLTSGNAHSLVVQATGRAVVGYDRGHFGLLAFTSAGAVDTSFASGGRLVSAIDSNASGGGLSVDPSGKLVLAGNRWLSTSATDVALARYTAAGSLDSSLGIGGVTVVSLAPQLSRATATDLAIDEHGRYVVSVYATTADYVTQRDFVAMRFDVNGQPDAAFGVGGVASVHVDRDDEAKAVALDPAGNIVVAGSTGLNATRKTAALRFLP